MQRAITSITIFFCLEVFLGCAGPSINVLRRSGPPSALIGMTEVAVSFDARSMSVDGQALAQYVESRGPDGDELAHVLVGMNERVLEGLGQHSGLGVALAQGPSAHSTQIQLVVQYLEVVPGYYRGIVAQDGSVRAHVTFMVNGRAADELDITTRSRAAPAEEPTVRGRMHACGLHLGQLAGDYVRDAR